MPADSVDRAWQVPHFEKMLYDQAMLAPLYLHGYQLTGDERWRQVVAETLDYVIRTLRDPSGGLLFAEESRAPTRPGLPPSSRMCSAPSVPRSRRPGTG